MKSTWHYVFRFCLFSKRNKVYTYYSSNSARKKKNCKFRFKFYSIICELTTWRAMKILLVMKAKEVLWLLVRIINLEKLFDSESFLLARRIFINDTN